MAPNPSSLRDAQKAMTRNRLLKAGAVLFARQGYASTKIEQIAREAGATRATFYLHFGAKADLWRALRDADRADDIEASEITQLVLDPHLGTIKAALHRRERALLAHPERTRALYDAQHTDPQIRADWARERAGQIDELATRLLAVGTWDAERAKVFSSLVWLGLDALRESIAGGVDSGTTVDVLAQMWLAIFHQQRAEHVRAA
jgi:AcrR family transcriptional regulator